MPLKRIKDRSRLMGTKRLQSRTQAVLPNGKGINKPRPHYIMLYLWETKEAMLQNLPAPSSDELGACCQNTWNLDGRTWEKSAPPLLSEVHFVKDRWDEEVVAHEICHALLHRIRTTGPPLEVVICQNPMAAEEEICYEMGRWVMATHRWLWSLNPTSTPAGSAP